MDTTIRRVVVAVCVVLGALAGCGAEAGPELGGQATAPSDAGALGARDGGDGAAPRGRSDRMAHGYPGSDTFPADITIPDDGDAPTAASVGTAMEQLADRTTYLAGLVGSRYSLLALARGGSPIADGVIQSFTSASYVDGPSGIMTLSLSVESGDVIEAAYDWNGYVSSGASEAFATTRMVAHDGGTDFFIAYSEGGTVPTIPATTASTRVSTSGAGVYVAVNDGTLVVKVQAKLNAATMGASFDAYNGNLTVKHYRINP